MPPFALVRLSSAVEPRNRRQRSPERWPETRLQVLATEAHESDPLNNKAMLLRERRLQVPTPRFA